MSTLNVSKNVRPDGQVHIALSGAIDEGADLSRIFDDVQANVVMNLERVERMNSIGIQRWIPVVKKFTADRQLEVEALSYSVVLQANAIANLFAGAAIRSCMAPYYCTQCRTNRVVEVGASEVQPGTIPARSCGECRREMEFDELDSYFAFLFRSGTGRR